MTFARGRGLRGALLAAVAGTLSFAAPAAAQSGAPGADLRRQLTTLADNPDSVAALIDAGRAALDLGDGTAALGFFTRAAELAPRDARAKAGLAAANVHNGNTLEALRLFQEALSLGHLEAALAGDRGLAYDLIGQPARAQQDYVLALRHREDPEIRRRLALSLAITGQREPALRVIEGLVRSGDRASLRTRAFVLALSGDAVGARDAARAAMPNGSADAMVPFLQRMANLSPVQMASAAHLGRFPTTGGGARASLSADPGALAFAGGSASPLQGRLPIAVASTADRRRPGAAQTPVRVAETRRTTTPPTTTSRPPAAAAAVTTPRLAINLPHPHEPLTRTASAPASAPTLTAQVQAPVELAGVSTTTAAAPAVVQPAAPDPGAWERLGTAQAVRQAMTQPAPVQTAAIEAPATQPAASRIDFTDVAAAISALPVEAERAAAPAVTRQVPAQQPIVSQPRNSTPQRNSATRTARAETPAATGRNSAATTRSAAATGRNATASNRNTARTQTPAQRHPERLWVQIATAARGALPGEYARLRRVAPELLRNRNAYTAPSGSSARLLVGPFATPAEARAFINRLNREDISAFAWSSTAGQEVAQVPAGR
ncbi:MAG: SPOR domain-containing protein [Allosphingosinicella sp.]|uniref:tetratricopeptide repeat protein n=1 Tax=Allosphingosinicella sp. TaxID=2823234 RepID=UPI00392C65EF